MVKKSSWTSIILLGGLAVGGYFLYKYLSGGSTPTPTPPIQGGTTVVPPITINIPEIGIRDTFTPGGTGVLTPPGATYKQPETTPGLIIQAQQAKATVFERKTGSVTQYIANPPTGTKTALLTGGEPLKQITTYNLAPRIIKIGGVSKKVM